MEQNTNIARSKMPPWKYVLGGIAYFEANFLGVDHTFKWNFQILKLTFKGVSKSMKHTLRGISDYETYFRRCFRIWNLLLGAV